MTDEMKLEYAKLGVDITKFVLGTVLLGLLGSYASNTLKVREVALKERESERLEMELYGKYVEHALAENVGTRERFARYFYRVTRTAELKRGWEEYLKDVVQEKAVEEGKEAKLAKQEAELKKLAASDRAKAEELKAVRQELKEVRSRLEVRKDAVAPGGVFTGHGSGYSSGSATLSVSGGAAN
jgi:hypothetical protein